MFAPMAVSGIIRRTSHPTSYQDNNPGSGPSTKRWQFTIHDILLREPLRHNIDPETRSLEPNPAVPSHCPPAGTAPFADIVTLQSS